MLKYVTSSVTDPKNSYIAITLTDKITTGAIVTSDFTVLDYGTDIIPISRIDVSAPTVIPGVVYLDVSSVYTGQRLTVSFNPSAGTTLQSNDSPLYSFPTQTVSNLVGSKTLAIFETSFVLNPSFCGYPAAFVLSFKVVFPLVVGDVIFANIPYFALDSSPFDFIYDCKAGATPITLPFVTTFLDSGKVTAAFQFTVTKRFPRGSNICTISSLTGLLVSRASQTENDPVRTISGTFVAGHTSQNLEH